MKAHVLRSLNSTTFFWLALIFAGVFLTLSAHADSKGTESKDAEPTAIKIESGNPMSGDADAIKAGRKLYVRWCQQCHGVKLDGYSPRWGKHGADLRKFWKGFRQFALIVLEGEPKKRMPAHKEYLSGEDVLRIGAFIETKSLEGANWK